MPCLNSELISRAHVAFEGKLRRQESVPGTGEPAAGIAVGTEVGVEVGVVGIEVGEHGKRVAI